MFVLVTFPLPSQAKAVHFSYGKFKVCDSEVSRLARVTALMFVSAEQPERILFFIVSFAKCILA